MVFTALKPIDYLIYGVGLLCLIVILWIMTKRWFWLVLFGISVFASFLATLYFFMHAEMQSAIGCIILTAILGLIYLKFWDIR